MQISTLIALAPFIGAAIAVPTHHAHEKFHLNKKREIDYFTVTSEVVETIYETTTIWVAPGGAAASSSPVAPASPSSPSVPAAATPTAAPSSAAATSGNVGLQQPSPPAQSPAPQSPPAASPPAASPSPPAASPSPPAASPSPAPASPSAAPAPSSAPAAQPSSGSGGSGSSPVAVSTLEGATDPDGPCTDEAPCKGQATFYQVGLGACGGNSDPSELVVALPVQIMGTQSNGNPLCGQSVNVQLFEGQSVKATVVDKCMGCNTAYSLDMSTGLFDALGGDQNVGRYYNMTWSWA